MNTYKTIIGIGVGVIVVLVIVIFMNISRGSITLEEYEIFIDPFKDKQDLFVMARVTIQNIGSKSLTNVRANFGSGDILELGTLKPGQKIIVSPPSDNPMEFVTITTDEGIHINKAYRIPIKIPGMMGS